MLKILLAGAAAVPLMGGLLLYSTGLAVVDVRQNGPDGTHLIIPVPLALANAALWFVDDKQTRIEIPEFAEHREAAIRLARELQRAPDGRFVEVEGPREHVTVEKSGDTLIVEVHDGEDEVLVHVPIAAIEELLESYDGHAFAAEDVLAAVRRAPSGEWVRVRDGADHVRVWIW